VLTVILLMEGKHNEKTDGASPKRQSRDPHYFAPSIASSFENPIIDILAVL